MLKLIFIIFKIVLFVLCSALFIELFPHKKLLLTKIEKLIVSISLFIICFPMFLLFINSIFEIDLDRSFYKILLGIAVVEFIMYYKNKTKK